MSEDKQLNKENLAVESDSLKDEVEIKRRKAITRIVASAGIVATMSGNWKKPVLNSAVLPAHAESTCGADGDCEDGDESDIRLKKNIQKIESSGIEVQLYRFEYLDDTDHKIYVGVMAQDLEESHPEALVKGPDGFYRVYYQSLGLKMTTLEEWNKKGIEAVKIN